MKTDSKIIKPFLRWAGGKTWLTKSIINYIPKSFNHYYEPFLGGGAIFFYLKSKRIIKGQSYLSDSNSDLINAYEVIKDQPKDLFLLLNSHLDSEDVYYKMRESTFDDPIKRAAQFLYLNKTSFNGIYRVNKKGKYNVPYGRRNLKVLYNFDHLKAVSALLKNTYLSTNDFKQSCEQVERNDFVFIDPPYTVAHENNGFIQYNQSIFSWKNQLELSSLTADLDHKQAYFLVTNAYHNSIKEIYNTGEQIKLSRASTIGGKGAARTRYKEIMITNIKNY